jgi:MFS family permease
VRRPENGKPGKTGRAAMKKNRYRRFWTKAAICTAGYGMMSDSVFAPLINAIFRQFPSTGQFLQNYIISGAAIVSVATGLLAGVFMKRVSKRRLLIWGTCLFFVGGVGCAIAPDMIWLAVFRSLDAASDGILTVTAAAMIVELWHTEREQSRMYGWYNAATCLFGAVVSVGAGYAATVSWRLGFAINAISILSVILCILFVPETGITDGESEAEAPLEDWEKNLRWRPGAFLLTMLAFAVINILTLVIVVLMDVYVSEQGIGNSVQTGYLSSLWTLFGLVGSMTATEVMLRFRNRKLYAALFCAASSLVLLTYSLAHSFALAAAATAVKAVMDGWFFIYYNLYTARTVPRRQRGVCLAIFMTLQYADSAAAPYVPALVGKLTGSGTVAASCLFAAAVTGAMAVIYLGVGIVNRKKLEIISV